MNSLFAGIFGIRGSLSPVLAGQGWGARAFRWLKGGGRSAPSNLPQLSPPGTRKREQEYVGRSLGTIALLLCPLIVGCKLKPPHDMEEQPNVHPAFKPSDVFADGSSARPVPPGAVARAPADDASFAYADLRQVLDTTGNAPGESSTIPFPITAELLARGQQRFNIFCSMCHGRLGDGNGMIVQRGLTPPPSFHIDRLRNVSDGHIFNVITNGYGQMFSYNDRIEPEDRWMIVAYVRALQASTSPQNTMATLDDADRKKLEGRRP